MNDYTPPLLVLDQGPGQDRLGIFNPQGRLLEVWFDALHRPNFIGTVHNVQIEQVFTAQNRATARFAGGVPLSLHLRKHDRDLIIPGAVVPVTINAAPRHAKPWQGLVGARLVARDMILLAGLGENAPQFQFSSQIPADIRPVLMARLTAEAGPFMRPSFGLILRRSAPMLADFSKPLKALITAFDNGCNQANDSLSGHGFNPGYRGCLHDGGGMTGRAMRMFPHAEISKDPQNIAHFSSIIDDVIDAALLPHVPLETGGQLWCQQTHALWSIDVDGGSSSSFDWLIDAAAPQISRQIRLRGMSGPVLIDVPRLPPALGKRFLDNLRAGLADDPRQPEYLGRTRAGFIELRVPHGDWALADVMQERVAQDALAGLRLVTGRVGSGVNFKPVRLAVSQAMANWMQGEGRAAFESLDRPVELVVWSDNSTYQTAHIAD